MYEMTKIWFVHKGVLKHVNQNEGKIRFCNPHLYVSDNCQNRNLSTTELITTTGAPL